MEFCWDNYLYLVAAGWLICVVVAIIAHVRVLRKIKKLSELKSKNHNAALMQSSVVAM